jgi:hypothetical protein
MVTGEANASVDVFWRSKDGYEMHLQLGGTSSETVLDDAQAAITKIKKAGGEPRPHRYGTSDVTPPTGETPKCSVCSKEMKYREGEGRNGKPYKGFFCPDRECEGKPIWVDD